jgi:hypothetical protein
MPSFDVFSLGDWVLPILEQPEKSIGECEARERGGGKETAEGNG